MADASHVGSVEAQPAELMTWLWEQEARWRSAKWRPKLTRWSPNVSEAVSQTASLQDRQRYPEQQTCAPPLCRCGRVPVGETE